MNEREVARGVLIQRHPYLGMSNYDFTTELESRINSSMEVHEVIEQSKWHDLRKNPEALPEKDDLYYVAILDEVTEKIYYDHWQFRKDKNRFIWTRSANIIAWRELPAFKEAG